MTRRKHRPKRRRRGRDQNEFTPAVRRELAKRVRYRCGVPRCPNVTVGPRKGSTKAASSGWTAHIHGAAPGSARYRANMTPAQRRSPHNGIHMCAHHGMVVDKNAKRYPASLMRRWKRAAEARADREHELGIREERSSTSNPCLVCVGTPTSRIFDKPGGLYKFTVSQIWFENRPRLGSATATALAGYVSVFHGKTCLFRDVRCEWVVANAHANVGFDDTRETWSELQPNGDRAKLFVVLKHTDDSASYMWTRGALEYEKRGNRHPSFRLPEGDYRLVVRVLGANVDQVLQFNLSNPGRGVEQSLSRLESTK